MLAVQTPEFQVLKSEVAAGAIAKEVLEWSGNDAN